MNAAAWVAPRARKTLGSKLLTWVEVRRLTPVVVRPTAWVEVRSAASADEIALICEALSVPNWVEVRSPNCVVVRFVISVAVTPASWVAVRPDTAVSDSAFSWAVSRTESCELVKATSPDDRAVIWSEVSALTWLVVNDLICVADRALS